MCRTARITRFRDRRSPRSSLGGHDIRCNDEFVTSPQYTVVIWSGGSVDPGSAGGVPFVGTQYRI